MRLPLILHFQFEEVIKVKLENPHSIRIPKANLNFCPYYLIHYVLNVNRKDPTGKNHHIHQQGIHILNAFNGHLLTDKGNTESKSFMNIFIPKRISNKSHQHDDVEEYSEVEKNEIVTDLKTLDPVSNYKIKSTEDYSVNIIEDKISFKTAERTVYQKIIKDNTTKVFFQVRKTKGKKEEKEINIIPRYVDITIEKKILVYLPKWIILIKAGACLHPSNCCNNFAILISYFQLKLSPTLRPIFLTTDIGIVLLSDLRFELFSVAVVISPSPSSYQLFFQAKTPIEVAIKLDLKESQVTNTAD
jgi:hypothetical protein